MIISALEISPLINVINRSLFYDMAILTISSQVDVLSYTYKSRVGYIKITMTKHNLISDNNTGNPGLIVYVLHSNNRLTTASVSLSEAKLK